MGSPRPAPPLPTGLRPGRGRSGCPRGSWRASPACEQPDPPEAPRLPSLLPWRLSPPPLPGQPVCLRGVPAPFPPQPPPSDQRQGRKSQWGAPPAERAAESLGSGSGTWGSLSRSLPGALLGRMKQQPLLSARVKCDRKIGEAVEEGAGPSWATRQCGFSHPHPHLPIPPPGPRGLGYSDPCGAFPREQDGVKESQTQLSVIPRAESQRRQPGAESSWGNQGRLPGGGSRCWSAAQTLTGGVWQCVLWRWEDGPQGVFIRTRHLATGVGS